MDVAYMLVVHFFVAFDTCQWNVTTQHELVQSSVCADSRFYDTECDLNCSDTCINSRCELQKTTLACKDGCVDGKQGTCCQEDCLSTCSKYERYGSICVQCSNVFNYGKKCDKRCPQNCKGRCAKLISDCRMCASRFKGPECEKPYRPGCEECRRYGKRCIRCLLDRKDCMSPCPQNCLRCHKDTWNCSKCAQRYTVRTCDEYLQKLDPNAVLITCSTLRIVLLGGVLVFLYKICAYKYRHQRRSETNPPTHNQNASTMDVVGINGTQDTKSTDYDSPHKYWDIHDTDLDSVPHLISSVQ